MENSQADEAGILPKREESGGHLGFLDWYERWNELKSLTGTGADVGHSREIAGSNNPISPKSFICRRAERHSVARYSLS
jgi:hypothetical protein